MEELHDCGWEFSITRSFMEETQVKLETPLDELDSLQKNV